METNSDIDFPFKYHELGHEETEELKNYFVPMFTKIIRVGTKGYFLHKEFLEAVKDIYNMDLRPSDTFVVTFARSGTTWTQELVWLLQNECDFEKAKATPLTIRFPFIEFRDFMKLSLPKPMVQNIEKTLTDDVLLDSNLLSNLPSPRFLKSHLPISILPPSLLDIAKVVYVARDPRDVAVSLFFHLKSMQYVPKERDFKPFWNYFIQSKVLGAPYFEHVKEAWNKRNHPNMMFIFYEELKKDLPAVARRLAKFFGKEYSERQYQELCDHLQFDNFKNNSSVNYKDWQDTGFMLGNFIRKGTSGGWREHFDDEMTRQAERWIADNLRDTDLRLPET